MTENEDIARSAEQMADESAEEAAGLVMYCRSWCGDCARARTWLDEHNIAYTEVDVEESADARIAAANINDGRLHTPTFVMGTETCVDFRPERLKELLELE
ncbi:MAG: glutaredoxin family protein [Actinobacteria bacterium]|nr:MAG: glutaredoxin family protein [Actinomycetota bacterium]